VSYPKTKISFICGCGTFCLTLKEKHGLRLFEKKMLRGIFGPKRVDVTGRQRKLHKNEHNFCSSQNIWVIISRRMGRTSRMLGGDEKFIQNFSQKI
jgi:hypothetical protein